MNLVRSVGAIASASGEEAVDWAAAVRAATGAIDPGSIDMPPGESEGYAGDVRDARDRIRAASGLDFDLPNEIEIQNRHHWIEANAPTFREVMRPLADRQVALPGVARTINTAAMSGLLAFLARHVLGQYDPLFLADGAPRLYFVRPNVRRFADELDVDYERFRRWIVFHEVTHAAEFGTAPWLADELEADIETAMSTLTGSGFDREAFRELDATMTAVEGYAEFLMDRAFDDRSDDLREKVDARRRGGGPLRRLVRRLLGLGMKRRQYERGKAFFDTVADARGVEAAGAVWRDPGTLPTDEEFDDPESWIDRVDP